MKVKMLAGLILFAMISVMAGCGGGGSGGAAGGGPGTGGSTPGTTVSGVASKGPVAGGTVRVFPIISSATANPRANIPRIGATPLAQATTGADGSYSVTIPASYNKGGLLIQINGGSYTDESTGSSRRLDDQYGASGMRAIFGNISGVVRRGGSVNASVTPYTEMAARLAGANPTDRAADDSNAKVAGAFGLRDIVRIQPLDANTSFPSTGSDDAKKYALALGTISQFQKEYGGGATMEQLTALFTAQLAGGPLDALTATKLAACANNYAGSPFNPNLSLADPATNPNAPAAMTLSANASRGVTAGAPVLLAANVTQGAGGAVPDGTAVSFQVSAGSGTLSGATTTSGGLATVQLASSTANASVTVTARCGTVSKAITIPFIAQPTKALVTLTTTGTLPAGALIGGINATVNYSTGSGLGILPASVTASGVAAASTLVPNTTGPGHVVLGLIDVNGFPVGNFVTLSFDIAAGNFPTAADFSVASGSTVLDTLSQRLGNGIAIAGVTIQ